MSIKQYNGYGTLLGKSSGDSFKVDYNGKIYFRNMYSDGFRNYVIIDKKRIMLR